jgi:DNA-binding XRE family transcriptional regulator
MMTADPVFFFVCQPAFIELERNKVRKGDISKDTIKKIRRWAEFNIDTLNDILEITDKTIKIFEKGKNKILKFEEIFNEK